MINPIDWAATNSIIGKSLYSGFSKYLIDISHRQLARFGNQQSHKGKILEIGAGRGEHFPFVKTDFDSYEMTDISDWGSKEVDLITKIDSRVKFSKQDIQNLNFKDKTFDRIIVSCVIAHVDEPYKSLEEVLRTLKINGVCSIYISGDPGILLRCIRFLITRPKMRELREPYSLINAISHRNSAPNIMEMAKWIYRKQEVHMRFYPFRIKLWNLSTHIILDMKRIQ